MILRRKKTYDVKVVKSNCLNVYGLNDIQISKIKDDLTFNNPAYLSAKRFAKNPQIVRIPPYVIYYDRGIDSKGNKFISVPVGYDISSVVNNFDYEEHTVSYKVEYPLIEENIQLRDNQTEAVISFIKQNKERNDKRGLIVLPTGKGKSIVGIYLAAHFGEKTLIVVHKDDLVVGWKKDIDLCFGGKLETGLIKAKAREIGKQITIATIQTLNRLDKDTVEDLSNTFGMIIIDEAHHCPASSYDFLMRLKPKYRLGLTATPERSDGLSHLLNLHFGGIAYEYEVKENEEDILSVEVISKSLNIYVDPVLELINKKTHRYSLIDDIDKWKNPFSLSDREYTYTSVPYKYRPQISNQVIEDVVLTDEFIIDSIIGDIYKEFNKGSNIVCFFTQKKHIDLYYKELIKLLKKEKIQKFYGDSDLSSEQIIENAENGGIKITLATYAKGTEGTNVKAWDTEFLISSVNNGKTVEQAAGRIRRVKEGKRKVARIYDYSFPRVAILRSHFATRLARYQKLGFIIKNAKQGRTFKG